MALWNDDFHHSALVALTGRNEAYYTDYHGTPQELVSALKWGYLYQGQRYSWQKQRRGTPAFGVSPAAFITYIQNHDQVANSGWRTSPPSADQSRTLPSDHGIAAARSVQHRCCSKAKNLRRLSPFLFFADHRPELAKAVRKGRAEFLNPVP